MTRSEAVAKLKIYRDYLCKMSSWFDVNEVAKPFNMAIRSLEAWDKIKNDLDDLWLKGYSPHIEVMEIIDRHLKEVEE